MTVPATSTKHWSRPVGTVDGLVVVEHRFRVPLAHRGAFGVSPAGSTFPGADEWALPTDLTLFAREVRAGAEMADYGDALVKPTVPSSAAPPEQRPWLLFLQGGPGMRALRPLTASGWLIEAVKHFRVLLLDQRGTGLSTPVTTAGLLALPNDATRAAYLSRFRAPDIVADAEAIRRVLAGPDTPWSTLGQSFGGFCTLTYLSAAPEGLRESLITGGLAGIHSSIEEVYVGTSVAMATRNHEFYNWYPDDQQRARTLVEYLEQYDVHLPTGEQLTPQRLQSAGILLGGNGKVHALHHLLEDAFAEHDFVTPGRIKRLSPQFLESLGSLTSFAAQPMYALLHEAIYAEGCPTGWAAERVLSSRPEFAADSDPFLFTGEAVRPFMFDEDPSLVPLTGTMELLAHHDQWGPLYNREQLRKNTIPTACAVYRDDIFVPHQQSLHTAGQLGAARVWESAEHHHDGLTQDGPAIFDRLLGLARLGAAAD